MKCQALVLGTLVSLRAAAMMPSGRGSAHGLVYSSPISAVASRGAGSRLGSSSRMMSAAMVYRGRQGRHYPVAAQLGGNVVSDTFFGGFHNFLSLYNLVLTCRILLSWFPQFARQPVFEPLFTVTNPFFSIFRGLIPPIGGVDLSPLPAFFLLSFVTQATDSLGADLPSRSNPQPSSTSNKQQQQPATTLVRCGAFRVHVPAGLGGRFGALAAARP